MLRIIRWIAIGLAIALLATGAVLWLGPGGRVGKAIEAATGIAIPGGVQVGGPFALVDQTGEPVTDATWRGRWLLVYFGYTYCPDICPTELQAIAAALDLLGPLASGSSRCSSPSIRTATRRPTSPTTSNCSTTGSSA